MIIQQKQNLYEYNSTKSGSKSSLSINLNHHRHFQDNQAQGEGGGDFWQKSNKFDVARRQRRRNHQVEPRP